MILDLLANHAAYLALHPRLRPGFAWLTGCDWSNQPDGRCAIAGEEVFAIVESGTTAPPESRRYESHRRHLDIPYVIAGGERMGWCPAAGVAAGEQAAPDLWFHPEPAAAQLITVPPGHFAIFAPGEAHKPLCALPGGPTPFRKCVVKVAWD